MNRPKINEEHISKAAQSLSASLEGLCEWERPLLAESMASGYTYPMGKFRLARLLETDFGWNIEMMDTDGLAKMDSLVREEHRKTCAEWVKDADLQPQLEIGDHVIYKAKRVAGPITRIAGDEAPGCYEVIHVGSDGMEKRKRVFVPFEEAVALTGTDAPDQ